MLSGLTQDVPGVVADRREHILERQNRLSLSHRLGNAYGNPVFLRETTYQWALDAFVDAWNDYHHCMAG